MPPPHDSRPPPLLCVCAWCGRWRDAARVWHDQPAVARADRDPTHGICPRCFAEQAGEDTVYP